MVVYMNGFVSVDQVSKGSSTNPYGIEIDKRISNNKEILGKYTFI